jgi:hypothetical protein
MAYQQTATSLRRIGPSLAPLSDVLVATKMRVGFVLLSLAALLSAGCTHVAPYERGALAHPTMTAAALDCPAAGHVRAVHEGATGGGSVAESGCGCN